MINLSRKLLFFVFLFCFYFTLLNAEISNFNCSFNNNLIVISWEVFTEGEINKYIVQKSGYGVNFKDIASVSPKGDNSSYSLVDKDLYNRSYSFFYRVKLLNKDNTHTYSENKKVVVVTSAVSTTWGSLKAMFK